MTIACRLLFALCALGLVSVTSFLVGQFDERAAWLKQGPVCVDLVLRGGRFELKSNGIQVLEYGAGK